MELNMDQAQEQSSKKNSQILSNVLSKYKFQFIFKVVLVYHHEWFAQFPLINVLAPHNFS